LKPIFYGHPPVTDKCSGHKGVHNRGLLLYTSFSRGEGYVIDKVYWNSCEDHVQKIERGYWEREGLHLVQPTTIIDMMDCSDSE